MAGSVVEPGAGHDPNDQHARYYINNPGDTNNGKEVPGTVLVDPTTGLPYAASGGGGSGGTVTQGPPGAIASPWPMELTTDGVNVAGTATHPVRTDPTGTTPQPISGTVSVNPLPAGTNSIGSVSLNAVADGTQSANANLSGAGTTQYWYATLDGSQGGTPLVGYGESDLEIQLGGTFNATTSVAFQYSDDGWATAWACPMLPGNAIVASEVTSAIGPGPYSFVTSTAGRRAFRIAATFGAADAGTVTAIVRTSFGLRTRGGAQPMNVAGYLAGEDLTNNWVTVAVRDFEGQKATYRACTSSAGLAGVAGDLVVITGSASKTVRVRSIRVSAYAASAASTVYQVIKRNAPDTGGTSTALTPWPTDGNDTAVTATVAAYTAGPTVGSPFATVAIALGSVPTLAANTVAPVLFEFGKEGGQSVVLRGTSQQLALAVTASATYFVEVCWTEE